MLARIIIIISVSFQGVVSNRRFPDLNQGTILGKPHQAPWRNIWTTVSPPTTPKIRKLSVYDTIKATAAASKRISVKDPFHQRIVSPEFVKREPVFPTRHTGRYTSSKNAARPSTLKAIENNVKQYEKSKVSPTAETRFSGVQSPRSLINKANNYMTAVSEVDTRGKSANRTMARRSHSIGDTGLHEEAGMFDVKAISQEPFASGHLDLFAGNPANAIALYALDYGHDHSTSTADTKYARTSTILEKNSPNALPRFKILPDGSIVNFGTSEGHMARQQHFRTTSPLSQTTKTSVQMSAIHRRKQINPTSASRVQSSTSHRGTSIRNGERASVNIAGLHQKSFSIPAELKVQSTKSSVLSSKYKSPRGLDAHGGLPVDDSLSYVVDDPRRRKDDRYFLNSSNKSGMHYHSATSSDHISLEPGFTTRRKTSTTFEPTSTTRKKTTTKTIPTTSTTPATTTTETTTTTTTMTTTTTTTPKPKPKDDYWTKQGGVPINITYVNDNHICPSSRARWQDYTVYLETKPRLCMIQITFNARYKREPIYHNTWWGQNVEWIYRTVYDPEVRMVDLHGWGGSTWYG